MQSDTLQPLTVPPNSDQQPPAPGTTGAIKTADGLPALQVKGVNTQLFSQKMSDEADRLERLENAVQELRNDFDAMTPAIVRLVSIEGDIQALIKQLEVLNGDPNAVYAEDVPALEASALDETIPSQRIDNVPLAPLDITEPPAAPNLAPLPVQPAAPAQGQVAPPVTAPPAAVTQAPAIPAASPPPSAPPAASRPVAAQGTVVRDVRVGEHPGKTRIVLDVSGKTSFTADLDNQEHVLVIEIPGSGWSTSPAKDFAGSPLLSSYKVETQGDQGTLLIFQVRKPATIAYKAAMDNPDGVSQRIVIDLTIAP